MQSECKLRYQKGSLNSILPLKPVSPNDKVLPIFWADNINTALDKDTGAGALDITTMKVL